MDYSVVIIVAVIFIIRLAFLKVSKQNEQAILASGGKEYGVQNSKRLTILHILFYFSCLVEAVLRRAELDTQGLLGCALVAFALVMLYVVTQLLKGIWTVKLMIANEHKFNDHWLFRVVKHPNYFLNIVPELIGLALLCHALYSAVVILPFYAFVLYNRIEEEDRLIAEVIIPNGKI